MTIDADQQREKRQLRLRIGRIRRRIDGRIRTLRRDGRRLASWRTYVQRYPGCAVMAALGFGITVSAGLRGGRWLRWLGTRLVRRAADQGIARLGEELKGIWAESEPQGSGPSKSGGDDGRP